MFNVLPGKNTQKYLKFLDQQFEKTVKKDISTALK